MQAHRNPAMTEQRLLVAHVAPVFSTVPPSGYGGVERVIEELTAAQLSADPTAGGVSPVVLASSDSEPTVPMRGRVASIRSRIPPIGLGDTFAELRAHYDWAFDDAARLGADLVHLHGPWGLEYRPSRWPAPIVASIYDDTARADVSEPLLRLPDVHLVANSRSSRAKAKHVPWFATVLEGVLPQRYPSAPRAGAPYCCFVGELHPDKGLDLAITAARAAGLPLKVIGRPAMLDVDAALVDEQRQWLAQVLFPAVREGSVQYLGEMGEQRLMVMAAAQVLLAPMRIQEPFGRALAEAMACGTPVVTFRRGSTPELIREGVTGFMVDDAADLPDRIRRSAGLSAQDCRDHVARTLSMTRVVREYGQVYGRVLAKTPVAG